MDDDALPICSPPLSRTARLASILAVRERGFDVVSKGRPIRRSRPPTTPRRRSSSAPCARPRPICRSSPRRRSPRGASPSRRRHSGWWTRSTARANSPRGSDDFSVNIGLGTRGPRGAGGGRHPGVRGTVRRDRRPRRLEARSASREAPIRARTPPPEGLTVFASRHYGNEPRLQAFLEGRRVPRSSISARG